MSFSGIVIAVAVTVEVDFEVARSDAGEGEDNRGPAAAVAAEGGEAEGAEVRAASEVSPHVRLTT